MTTPLTLSDVGPAAPADPAAPPAVEVTLAQIVTRTVKLPTNARADSPLRVSTLNLKGLARIEQEFGSLDAVDEAVKDKGRGSASLLKLVTILVNQDLPDGSELSEEAVGRALSADRIALVNRVVEEMTRPLRAAPAGAKTAATEPPAAPTGAA